MNTKLISALFRALALGSALAALAPTVNAEPLPTLVVKPHAVDLGFPVDAVVEAVQQATVGAQVAGRVVEVKADAGQAVRKGELLMRIGQRGRRGDDDDTQFLGDGVTSCFHDIEAREVFVADGYSNHRIIAFNSDTGAFTRMWGAFGEKPSQVTPDRQYGSPVHKIARGPNGHMYVCDRENSRIQEFALVAGGACFLREVYVARGTPGFGAAFDIAFTGDGHFMLVADGVNARIWSVALDSFEVRGWTSTFVDEEGTDNSPATHSLVHRFAMEPNGDLLLCATTPGFLHMRYLGVS